MLSVRGVLKSLNQERGRSNFWDDFVFASPFHPFTLKSCWERVMGRKENISQPTLFDLILNYIHFDIAGDPYNLVYSHRCELFTNRIILWFKSHLFLSQWESFTKTQQPIRYQNNQSNCWEMKLEFCKFFTNSSVLYQKNICTDLKSWVLVTEFAIWKLTLQIGN